MSRRKKSHPEPGARPGTLVRADRAQRTRIRLHDFEKDRLDVGDVKSLTDLEPYLHAPSVTWVELTGLKDIKLIEELAELFKIHPLLIEDAVNTPVRPKAEISGEQQVLVLQMFRHGKSGAVERNQISLFVGENFVVSMTEKDWDIFGPIHQRIESGTRIRQRGPDYLAYAILDLVIDSYFPVIEVIGEHIDTLEGQITSDLRHDHVADIMRTRKRLQLIRRFLWPMREVARVVQNDESPIMSDSTLVYLRDCEDHLNQAHDLTEGMIEMTSQLMSLHSANLSNQLNETMKTLTIMSTIFIPLSFLAGLYGMNFAFMPELQWKWSYPAVLGLMVSVAVGLLRLFHKRGWIGRGR